MSHSQDNFDQNLSLIDVSFEDDSLYASPSHRSLNFSDDQTKHTSVQFPDMQTPGESFEEDGQLLRPLESLEQAKTRNNEKCNLRKSLAWDSAFFTSAGVLEPEELSSIIKGAENNGRRHVLPGIEEDLRRSTDSISTLATDSSTLGNLEDDLFGDIRASIQKSCKASSAQVSHDKLTSLLDETKLTKSQEKADHVYQNKLKAKDALKKPNFVKNASGKIASQVSPSAQNSKSSPRIEKAATSICKPPKIVGRPSAILPTASATKRASLGLGANCVKGRMDDASTVKDLPVPARGIKVPAIGASRNTVPKPMPAGKSSSRSSMAIKTQPTTSSSIDSLESLSSDSSSKHSLNIVKRKIDPRTSTVKTALRTASRNKNQSSTARSSPSFATRISSGISPASSISEWSSESLSPTSTLNKRSNSSRPSPKSGEASQPLGAQNHSNDKCSLGKSTQVTVPSKSVKRVLSGSGAVVRPGSLKPSGLRMPSPKIGFFDGVRSSVRTPSGSGHSLPTVPSDSPRFVAGNVSSSGGSSNVKSGKSQPARIVMPTSEFKPKSPSPLKESLKPAPNVHSARRNGKLHGSVKVQNRKSPSSASPKSCNSAIKNPDLENAESNVKQCKDKMSSPGGGNDAKCYSRPMSEVDNIICLQKGDEDATNGKKNDLHFSYNEEQTRFDG